MSQLNLETRFEASKADYEPPHQCIMDTITDGDLSVYVGFTGGDDHITLDGEFSVPQLEEILTFMRNHPPRG